jgi:hypothetical protein
MSLTISTFVLPPSSLQCLPLHIFWSLYFSYQTIACILKAQSHSKSGGSIWASLECQCCIRIAEGLVSYLTMRLLTLQLFKNSADTQEKLRLNLHSLSVSELSEYRRKTTVFVFIKKRFFGMLRNTRSKLMRIIYHLRLWLNSKFLFFDTFLNRQTNLKSMLSALSVK